MSELDSEQQRPGVPVSFGGRVGIAALDILGFFAVCLVGIPLQLQTLPSDMQDKLAFAVFAAYFIVTEWRLGKTPGKAIWGARVETLSGARPSLLQCVGRFAARCVSILLGIGLLPLYIIYRILGRRMLQDAVTGTRVVSNRPKE